MNLQVLLIALSLPLFSVRANFELIVNFINYTNPTGLCAECETRLEDVTSADQLTPVCCDEWPFRSDNCDNTGEARCDTRFRWTIRPFGAPLETRPLTVLDAINPPYSFTNCNLPGATCPFSEMNTPFSQGSKGFLGVAANPLRTVPKPNTLTSWPGRVQFFIEAVDSGLPNIIDSLLINLDNLQLGADFTEEMMFTGYHNISHMTMSFRVACQTGFCGAYCLTTPRNNRRVLECHPNGTVVCVDNRLDPSTDCNTCLYNLDITSTCLTCLNTKYDPQSLCTQCLFADKDPNTNCTQCLPNRDPSTNCSTCLPGWDRDYDCSMCLPGRNISTNCTSNNYSPCTATASPINSFATISGLYSGVIGFLVIIILILITVLICTCKRIRRNKDLSTQPDIELMRNKGCNTSPAPGNKETQGQNYVLIRE